MSNLAPVMDTIRQNVLPQLFLLSKVMGLSFVAIISGGVFASSFTEKYAEKFSSPLGLLTQMMILAVTLLYLTTLVKVLVKEV
jgi:hypothetical protein